MIFYLNVYILTKIFKFNLKVKQVRKPEVYFTVSEERITRAKNDN
jgi:hypothetical protein